MLALACGMVASAHAGPPTTGPAFEQLLTEIDARAGKIQTLQADFEQVKESPLVVEPIKSSGAVRAISSAVVWTADKPQPIVTRIANGTLEIFYPDQKQLEVYDLAGDAAAMTASPLPRLETLRKAFTIEHDAGDDLPSFEGVETLALRLKPIEPAMAKYVDHVRVVLDVRRGLVLVFELTDPDGEITTTRFENVRTNVPLTADDLKLNVPPGTKVVRPAEKLR